MAPMAGDAEEPTEELNDPLIRLNAVQQNVRRKILEAVNLPVTVRTWPTSCGCIGTTPGLVIRQKNCTLGGTKIKSRKRSRNALDPESGASIKDKKRQKQQEADARVQEALGMKTCFSKFLAELNGERQALGDKVSGGKDQRGVLGQHVVAFHARKEEELLQKKAEEQRKRFECLRRSDMEGYLKLAKELKSSRVNDILERSKGCMEKLNARMARISGSQNGKGPAEELGCGSEAFVQPTTLSGGALHQYQMEGLKWLTSLHARRLNGILADEMGLGKTVQVIALICYLLETGASRGPFLIAAPASVLPNWLKEFQFWAPGIPTAAYAGSPETREEVFRTRIRPWTRKAAAQGAGLGLPSVVVTTYEMLMGKKDKGKLSRISWEYIILDEGHRIKNSKCRLNAELKLFKTKHRLLITGTPIQNNLEELWSLLNFLLPSIFASSDDFQSWFSLPLGGPKPGAKGHAERGGAAASSRATNASEEEAFLLSEEEKLLVVSRLHQMLRPVLLRRLKSSVLGALPQKREVLLLCAPSAYQRLLFRHVATLGLQNPQGAEATLELPTRSRRRGNAQDREAEIEREREAERREREGEGGGRGSLEDLLRAGRPKRLTVSNAVMELRVICNHPFLSKLHTPDAEEYLKDIHSLPHLYHFPGSPSLSLTVSIPGTPKGSLSGVPAAKGARRQTRSDTTSTPSATPRAHSLQQLRPTPPVASAVRVPGSPSVSPETRAALTSVATLTRCCGKLEVLDRVLTKLWVGGHRVLIFCTMTKMLDVLEEYLGARAQVFFQNESSQDEGISNVACGGRVSGEGPVEGTNENGTGGDGSIAMGAHGEKSTQDGGRGLPLSRQLKQQQHAPSQKTMQGGGLSLNQGAVLQSMHEDPSASAAGAAAGTPVVRQLPGKWEHCRLDGMTSKEEREEVIREFNAPGSETFIFLLSIRAGGQGINLQTADTVIFFDTDWNPQVDLQAQARAHRMGQQKDVLVIRLETAGTVEAKVRATAAQKLGLAHQSVTAGFFDGKASDKERRQYLTELLQQKGEEGEGGEGGGGNWQGQGQAGTGVTAQHPTAADITSAIVRSEAERAVFEAMDAALPQDETPFLVASQELRT